MEERAEEVRARPRPPRLTALQEQLVWALLESGLSRDILVQAVGELERDRATGDRRERGDGESSEEGEMDFSPPIFRDLEKLPSEQASKLKADVEQLLQEDSWHVAKMVKSYMQQHNLPQREVVEATGLNQSHLSQHLNKGTPMKNQKRAALYTWYVKKQCEISQQFTNAKHGLAAVEEHGEETRKGRRNRFKWGPASLQILFQAYERQKNPSKEEREGLVEECNRAECIQRGVSPSQLAGLGSNLVTEVRVYNWFANRRKEEAFRHKLALDTPFSQSSSTNHTLSTSPEPGLKYSQQMLCDGGTSARLGGGDRTGCLVLSPVQLEPSHTLLDVQNPKQVSSGGPLPPVSTLTSLHSLSASPSSSPSLIMASLPSVMSLGESSLLIGLTSTQPQTVPIINNMGGGFTTLQPISFQQQLHASPQQPIAPHLQGHMGSSPFMAAMAPLPCHNGGVAGWSCDLSHLHRLVDAGGESPRWRRESQVEERVPGGGESQVEERVPVYKSDSPQYSSSSLLSQALVIADSSGLGTLTSLTAVRQILTADEDDQTDSPMQEESLHMQPNTPVPASSESLELYPPSQQSDSHQSHLLPPSPADISYIPAQMTSTAQ